MPPRWRVVGWEISSSSRPILAVVNVGSVFGRLEHTIGKVLPVEPAILCTVVIRVKLRPMFAIIFKVIIPSPFEMRRR
jgi:hypothetical protein